MMMISSLIGVIKSAGFESDYHYYDVADLMFIDALDFWYSPLAPSYKSDKFAASLAWLRHTGHLLSSLAGRFEM